MQRRDFISQSLAAGAAAMLVSPAHGTAASPDTLDLAILGAGYQGRVLLDCLMAIGGVRVRAVCDIWKYRRTLALTYLNDYEQSAAVYEDYREMLDKTNDLHAVLVATPDFVHSEQTIACLRAGLHVYCEPPMAPTLDAAQAMADAARKSGKLLQIGYQRRSNPRYQHVHQKLLQEAKLLNDITSASTNWSQLDLLEEGAPRRHLTIPATDLQKYGYADMREFRNWRWFKRFCAAPFAAFAVHQVDVLNWLLGSKPKAVLAAGGNDYYKDRQGYDNVTAIYDYPVADRVVRATCQVLNTTSGTAGNYEQLVGIEGSVRISENPKWTKVFHEPSAAEWDEWRSKGYLAKVNAAPGAKAESKDTPPDPNVVHVAETGELTQYEIPVVLDSSPVQPHLENFLAAVRGKAELNCPADVALASEAAVLKALEAVEARQQLTW